MFAFSLFTIRQFGNELEAFIVLFKQLRIARANNIERAEL